MSDDEPTPSKQAKLENQPHQSALDILAELTSTSETLKNTNLHGLDLHGKPMAELDELLATPNLSKNCRAMN